MRIDSCVCYGTKGKKHNRGTSGCIWQDVPRDLWYKSNVEAKEIMEQRKRAALVSRPVVSISDEDYEDYEDTAMVTKPKVKERAEEMSTFMSDVQQTAIRQLANDLHRVNTAVMRCVELGLAVELQRVARHHAEDGYWGDMLIPVIMKQNTKKDL